MKPLPRKAYLVGYHKLNENHNYVYCLFYDKKEAIKHINNANMDSYMGKDRIWGITTLQFLDADK